MMMSVKNLNGAQEGSNASVTEQGLYGENTAVGIMMLALEAERVGIILHINDEIERTLGYQRKNVIGIKINNIQPAPISVVHDSILNRFLNTAKRTVLNTNLQLFSLTSEGYLRPIWIIVKLYPQMSDKIIIVGYIQVLYQIEGFDLPKINSITQGGIGESAEAIMDSLTHHYLITDFKGVITCVSEGLWKECGLHAKFFDYFNNLQQSLKLEHLFEGNLTASDFLEAVQSPMGLEYKLDTNYILDSVNLE